MKKTIKQEETRLVLQSELLNDNSLLEYVAEEGYMNVTVRFVDFANKSIQEHNILHMNIVEFMKHQQEVIEVNEGKDAIAIFVPEAEGYRLQSVYDTVTHEFGFPEFIDLEYKKRFPNQPLQKQYWKEKK